jgi:hypothetical protein
MKLNDLIAYITETGAGLALVHVTIKKVFNFDIVEKLKSLKLSDHVSIKLKGEVFEQSALPFTVQDLLSHDLFDELELKKRTTRGDFYTHEVEDKNKNKLFDIFIEEKMNSVSWSMKLMLDTYSDEMTPAELKTHILQHFVKCDDNLGCKMVDRFLRVGVPKHMIDDFMQKFWYIRTKTLKVYTARINQIFSSKFYASNEQFILTIFEIITFETRGMVKDVTEAFDSVNGAFLNLELSE